MSALVIIQRFLWFFPALLQVVMCFFMARRRLHRELPWFFAYTIFQIVRTAISWSLRHAVPHYFYFYWIAEFVSIVVGLAVIYEVFRVIVKQHEAVHRTGFLLYRWIAVALLSVATVTAATAPGMDSSRIIEGILTLERGVRIIQAGLLFFLFAFASYLGLSWRSYVFGIALGFGMFATIDLVLVGIRAHVGPAADEFYVWLKPVAYNCTALVWAIYLLQRHAAPKVVTSVPKTEVALWDQTLMEFTRR